MILQTHSVNRAIGAMVFTVATLTACSDGHKSGDGAMPDAPDEVAPEVASQVSTDAMYHLSLATANGAPLALANASGSVNLFTWSIKIDGVPSSSGTDESQEKLQAALSALSVRGGSLLDFTLTMAPKGGKIVATNLAVDAEKDPVNAKIWRDQCASVGTMVDVGSDVKVVGSGADATLSLDVPLCDFAGVLVAPTIGVTPANTVTTNFDVIFECTAGNDSEYSSDSLFYMKGPYESQCFVGYTRPRAGAVVTKNLLLDAHGAEKTLRAPNGSLTHPFEINTGLSFIESIPNRPAARRYDLTSSQLLRSDFADLGFVRASDCYALEVQALYKDADAAAAGVVKESRMTWKRDLDERHLLIWTPDDQTAMPDRNSILAARQITNRYWLHCKWENPKGLKLATVTAKDS